jgi:hypothetical protein
MNLTQAKWEQVLDQVNLGQGMKARISIRWDFPTARVKRTENSRRLELFLAELSLLGLDDLIANDTVDYITILGWAPIDLVNSLREMPNVGRVQVLSVKGKATPEQLEALRRAIPDPEPTPKPKPEPIEEVQ